MTTSLLPHLPAVHHARGHQPEVTALDSPAKVASCRLGLDATHPGIRAIGASHPTRGDAVPECACIAVGCSDGPLIDRDRGGSPQVPWSTWASSLPGCGAKVTTLAGVPGHGQVAAYPQRSAHGALTIFGSIEAMGERYLAVPMNGPPTEVPLLEDAEALIDGFRSHLRRLEAHLTLLDEYRQERHVLRSLERRGVNSEWARRELAHRWKSRKEVEPEDDEEPQDAA